MKFTNKAKSYDIDLTLPERHRREKVIENELPVGRKLVRNIRKNIDENTPWWIPDWLADAVLKPGFRKLYKICGGLYLDEMESWSSLINSCETENGN